MAKTSEKLDTVMEEVMDKDFETVAEPARARHGQCEGEAFPIFSDGEAEDDVDADDGRFVSRLTPLEQLERGDGDGNGEIDQPQIREGWLAAKLQEIAVAKGKLVRLDDAYNEKRRDLNRLLEDFEHLAEVKRQLTERVRDLTDQVTIARRLRHISLELCGGDEQGTHGRRVPRPPTMPPPRRLREAAMLTASREADAGRLAGKRAMKEAPVREGAPARREGRDLDTPGQSSDGTKNAKEAPTLLASVARRPPPPARWSPRRGIWVSVEVSVCDPMEEERRLDRDSMGSQDVWRHADQPPLRGTQPKSRAHYPPVEQASKLRKRTMDMVEGREAASEVE